MATVLEHTFDKTTYPDPNPVSPEFQLLAGQAYISISQNDVNDSVRVYLERQLPSGGDWKKVAQWRRMKTEGWTKVGDPDYLMLDKKGGSERIMNIADADIKYRFYLESYYEGIVTVYVGQG